ncbi:hypothetical protein, partial [Acinetobacter baumannii]
PQLGARVGRACQEGWVVVVGIGVGGLVIVGLYCQRCGWGFCWGGVGRMGGGVWCGGWLGWGWWVLRGVCWGLG